MKGIDWENRKGGGTKKCTPQPVCFPSLLAPSPIWFAPLELIVSPIQNPSEPGLTPNLAAKWRKINDPWPDLKVFSNQNSWYSKWKSSNHLRWLLGNRTLGHEAVVDLPVMMWQIFCKCVVTGWSGELELPGMRYHIQCVTHSHVITTITLSWHRPW